MKIKSVISTLVAIFGVMSSLSVQASVLCREARVKFIGDPMNVKECQTHPIIGDHLLKLCENGTGTLTTVKDDFVRPLYRKEGQWRTKKNLIDTRPGETEIELLSIDTETSTFHYNRSTVGGVILKQTLLCEGVFK